MKARKIFFVVVLLGILLTSTASGASAMSVKQFCFLEGGEYDPVNNTCTFDTGWAREWCLAWKGMQDAVLVVSFNAYSNTIVLYNDCVKAGSSQTGQPVDIYTGNCGAYVASAPPGGVSLIRVSNYHYLGNGWGDLLHDACQLRYAEGYQVYAQVYFNLTETNLGRWNSGQLALVTMVDGAWEECDAYMVDAGEYGRLACSTTATTFGLVRK